MLFEDTYLTIAEPAEGIYSAGGSKFVSYAFPVSAESEIKAILGKVKVTHPQATHHCWAVRLGTDQSARRFNDDGEPAGSAGRPIINTILSKRLNNVMVIVVRYFGGTLLGIPGLIGAYKAATEDVLNNAQIVEKTFGDVYKIDFQHAQMNEVMKIAKDDGVEISDQHFDNHCTMNIAIRKTYVERAIGCLQKIDGVKATYIFSA